MFCYNAKGVCLGKGGCWTSLGFLFVLGFFRWRGKYTCQRNEPRLWINELKEGRKHLFSSYSLYATPGCQSHCKISDNLARLFAFKSHFLTFTYISSWSWSHLFLSGAALSGFLSVLLCSHHSAPLGYISSTWNYLRKRFCLKLGQRWWCTDFSDLHNNITLQVNSCLCLKENTCLGPMLTQFRGALSNAVFPKWLFGGIFTTVYLRILLPASEECSQQLGTMSIIFLSQKFVFSPSVNFRQLDMEQQVCSSVSSLAPNPELCPGPCETPTFEQILNFMLKFCKLGFEWKEQHNSNRSLTIARKGNVTWAFYSL